jgi:hypothetical protein
MFGASFAAIVKSTWSRPDSREPALTVAAKASEFAQQIMGIYFEADFRGSRMAKLPVKIIAGRADASDDQLLASWLASLNSAHTRANFETTARRFLAELAMGLRAATVEDVRTPIAASPKFADRPLVQLQNRRNGKECKQHKEG